MGSVLQFGRLAELTVAPVDGSAGLAITGLRIVFEVNKTSTSEPNAARIQIYNLAEQTRGVIEQADQAVILKAGYEDLTSQIFAGVVKRLEHRREGTEIVTELECKDGGIDLLVPELRRSYASGTNKRRIIEDIIGAMPNTDRGQLAAAGIAGAISGRMSFSCSCKRALDRLARAWDFEWSIQDGVLNALDSDGTLEPKELALVISPKTGLIGSPTRTGRDKLGFKAGKAKKGKAAANAARKAAVGAKFKALMLPTLRPGSYVLLESEFLEGAFRVESLTHNGDTHGDDWTTEVEAKRI